MIELPNKKKCYNLPEQVAQNLLNIQYLAEQYKNIDALPAVWQTYKEEFDSELDTFEGWERTFGGWETTLETYLASMSSAAVGAIAGQNIAPANVASTGNITAPSIIETMVGYSWSQGSNEYTPIYVGVCKNGNKITMVVFGSVKGSDVISNNTVLGRITIPNTVGAQLYPNSYGSLTNVLDMKETKLFVGLGTQPATIKTYCQKESNVSLVIAQYGLLDASLNPDLTYLFRYECTFLLSDNLASI